MSSSDFVIENGVLTKYTGAGGDVVIPDGVTSIGECAFMGCENLKSVTISDSVESILYKAFIGCTGLTSLVIPDSVTGIGPCAFEYCTELQNITIPHNLVSLGDCVFKNTGYYNNTSNWDNDVLYISDNLIEAKKSISGVYTIKSETKYIAAKAFFQCGDLKNIIIPDGVTGIGYQAFGDCIELTELTIPDSIRYLDTNAFDGCRNLSVVNIPDSYYFSGEKLSSSIVSCIFPSDAQLAGVLFYQDGKKWQEFLNNKIGEKNCNEIICKCVEIIESNDKISPKQAKTVSETAVKYSNCIDKETLIRLSDVLASRKRKSEELAKIVCEITGQSYTFVAKSSSKPKKPETPLTGKKIALLGSNVEMVDIIKKKLKSIGCIAVTTVSKDIDIAVYSDYMTGPDSRYRSAVYQKDKNGKLLWNYDEFILELKKCGVDTSDIEDVDFMYPTDTREHQLTTLKHAIDNTIRYFRSEDALKFNDDFYEVEWTQNSGKYLDFDDDVLEALKYYDTQTILGTDADINSIINAFGGYKCIKNIIATCIATRMFLDSEFECKFRIYRDKWEERGDYGMAYGANEIPPAIYWEINKRHPFGYCSYK